MNKVLIIEDNRTIQFLEKTRIEEELALQVDVAETLKDTLELLEKNKYFIILADLTLPDAKDSDVIDAIRMYNIPIIVFTATFDKILREKLIRKRVLDYVLKDSPSSLDYVLRLIQFVKENHDRSIMIVDDSSVGRRELKHILSRLPLKVIEVGDADAALKNLNKDDNIKIVVTDHGMQGMNGLELTTKIRKSHSINDVVIIGLSESADEDVLVEYLKQGANDFLKKPFSDEELVTRVIQNIEMIDYIKIAKESGIRDFLTGLHNRRYLYDAGQKLYSNAKRKNVALIACMLDIDFFKKVNDNYGHQAGDIALKLVSDVLIKSVRESDIVARYGGEEFSVLLTGCSLEDARSVMEKVRSGVAELTINCYEGTDEEVSFKITISIGLNNDLGDSLDDMFAKADEALYTAKENGRNRIEVI